jgi:arginyl-tRNA synthetase
MFRTRIEKAIEESLTAEKFPKVDIEITVPPEERFGDYSTNVALKLASLKNDQRPGEIAKRLVPRLQKTGGVSKVDIVDPGFINFFLDPTQIQSNTQKIIEQDQKFGFSSKNKGKKARVEFVSANPTGPLHIGNARGGPLGDSIANVLESTGYKVTREYYDNNVGTQVEIFAKTLKKKIEGTSTKYDPYSGSYYKELAQKLKEVKEEELGNKATKIIFDEIIRDLKDMGIEFDEVQHESDLQEKKDTDKVLNFLKNKKMTREKEGALWFVPHESSLQDQEFLEDRESVLVRSNGSPTYFADDIAYHKKIFEAKSDLIINVLGSNHYGHVPRLQAAIAALGYDPSIYKVVLYQYVRVKRGNDIVKMSKRAGNMVTAREVLNEVGKDAFRFFILSHAPNTHMDFDLKLAKQQNVSNPVYYVQYAHARASNILKNAQKEGFSLAKFSKADLSLLSQTQELTLAKKLQKLPEIVEDTSETLAVHQLTTYLVEVADLFHSYYEKYKVLGEKDEIVKARLNLILATKITLRNTLNLIGVSAPERM